MKLLFFVFPMFMIVSPAMAEEASWMGIQICKSHQIMQHADDLAAKKISYEKFTKMIDDCYNKAGKKANYWRKLDKRSHDDNVPEVNITVEAPPRNPLRHINPSVDGFLPSSSILSR